VYGNRWQKQQKTGNKNPLFTCGCHNNNNNNLVQPKDEEKATYCKMHKKNTERKTTKI